MKFMLVEFISLSCFKSLKKISNMMVHRKIKFILKCLFFINTISLYIYIFSDYWYEKIGGVLVILNVLILRFVYDAPLNIACVFTIICSLVISIPDQSCFFILQANRIFLTYYPRKINPWVCYLFTDI